MKNLFYFLFAGLLATGIFSCTDDGTGDLVTGPSIDFTINPGAGYITGDATVNAGSTVKVKVTGTKGDNLLKTLTLTARKSGGSDQVVDFTKLKVNDQPGSANPILILDPADQNGLTYSFEWTADATAGETNYTFTLEDNAGNKDDISFKLTTRGMAISTLTGKKLTNSASPEKKGGINLYTGEETGSLDSTAVLSAEGNFPNLDWSQQFRATNPNTTQIRKAKTGFNFDGLQNSVELVDAFSEGTPLSSPVTGEKDAVYIVRKDTYYWAVKITDIKLTPPLTMGGDNLDHFVLTIKQ